MLCPHSERLRVPEVLAKRHGNPFDSGASHEQDRPLFLRLAAPSGCIPRWDPHQRDKSVLNRELKSILAAQQRLASTD